MYTVLASRRARYNFVVLEKHLRLICAPYRILQQCAQRSRASGSAQARGGLIQPFRKYGCARWQMNSAGWLLYGRIFVSISVNWKRARLMFDYIDWSPVPLKSMRHLVCSREKWIVLLISGEQNTSSEHIIILGEDAWRVAQNIKYCDSNKNAWCLFQH